VRYRVVAMAYRLLCLDAGFTLLSPRRTLADALSSVLVEDGRTVTEEEMRAAWEEADRWFWDEYHRPDNDTWSADDRIEAYWRRYHTVMLERLGVQAHRVMLDRILASQFAAEAWEPYPDVVPMLDAVRALDRVSIGVVSDWGSNLRGILAELDLDRYLDFVLPSGAVGLAKPNPAFFRVALDEARVAPSDAVMVGDSYRADVVGAWSAGMPRAWRPTANRAAERASPVASARSVSRASADSAACPGSRSQPPPSGRRTRAAPRIVSVTPSNALTTTQGIVPVVAGFQGIGTHGELTTLGRGGTDLSAVVLAVALRAGRCELFKDVGGVLEADPRFVPDARFLPAVDALQLELLAEMGAEVVHPVAVRRARRGRLHLVVRALEDDAPQTVVRPTSRDDDGVLMLAVDRKERMARVSLVGPASLTPEVLPLPAHGEGAFDEGGMRVVWAEVPLASAESAARAVHASFMTR
jgi:FMN phosphatase YigB (HAD superfamily)